MLSLALLLISLLIWVYIAFGRGWFWRVAQTLDLQVQELPAKQQKRVVAVVPARDEAEVVGAAIESLLGQDLDTPLTVVLVDDGSTDGTGLVALEAAQRIGQASRLILLEGRPLEKGWTGKLWALSQGVEHAMTLKPDYLLFTDADIQHGSLTVKHLVAMAERDNCELVSLMVKLACRSIAEKALIPAFVFFFLLLYPPAWTASDKSATAGAAGGCILIRPAALTRIGGLHKIRGAVIDDCALARAVKRSGGRVWMGLTNLSHSIRSYGSFNEIARMISRTAFSQLKHSGPLLFGTIAGLVIAYLVPILGLLSGRPDLVVVGALTWLLMTICYLPMVRFYGVWSIAACALPIVAMFYAGATVRSAFMYWEGKGGEWKNRVQDTRN